MFRWTRTQQGRLMGWMLASAVICLTGCGQDNSSLSGSSLTAPALESQAGANFTEVGEGIGGGDPGTGAFPAGGETPAAASAITVTLTGEVLEVSQLVPKHGATLTAGRFTYRILPNTFSQPTLITLRDVSGLAGRVECEVLPADLVLSKSAHLTSFFSDLMPVASCSMFEIQNSGAPSEAWVSLGGSLNGGGLKVNVNHAGHFSPGTTP